MGRSLMWTSGPSILPQIRVNEMAITLRIPDDKDTKQMWIEEHRLGPTANWRLGGSTVSLEEFAELIWKGTLLQVVVARDTDPARLLGVVAAYDYNPWDRWCRLGYCSYVNNGVSASIAFAIVVDRLFSDLPLQKIYVEVIAPHRAKSERVLGRIAQRQGTIRSYRFFDGEWVDLDVWAITRASWSSPDLPRLRRLEAVYGR